MRRAACRWQRSSGGVERGSEGWGEWSGCLPAGVERKEYIAVEGLVGRKALPRPTKQILEVTGGMVRGGRWAVGGERRVVSNKW